MIAENKRYPGPRPFSEQESIVFRGREKDVERLQQTLGRFDQVLVFAKSGVGKSSLIKAGLKPLLGESNWKIITVRFYPFRSDGDKRPVQRVAEELEAAAVGNPGSYLSRFLKEEDSLWTKLKSSQTDKGPEYLFIFDQFEELFTYPAKDISDFKKQVADLMYDSVPSRYLTALRKAEAANPDLLSSAEKNLLYKKQRIRILAAIRDDSLHHLLQLADYLPDLQQNLFELKPLDRTQALAAVVEPAEHEDPQFLSPPFEIAPEALSLILDFLTRGNTRPADSTLLQIICQDLEKKAAKKVIGISDLPNFTDLVQRFYLDIVENVPYTSSFKKLNLNKTEDSYTIGLTVSILPIQVRKFIEGRFIYSGRRVPIPENECEKELGKDVLKYLVDEHLLRAEQNSVGGLSYELGHDTLVDPITALKEKREAEETETNRFVEENRLREELEKQQAEREKEKRQLRKTRAALIFAVVGFLVAGVFFAYALQQKLIADENAIKAQQAADQAIIAEHRTDSLKKIADYKVEKYEIAEKARIKLQVDNLVSKAENFKRNGEKIIAIETLKDALKLDSTRVDIEVKIKAWGG